MWVRYDFRMNEVVISGLPPTQEVVDAIYATARVLGKHECFAHDGRYHFALGGGWTIAVSADAADRIRVDACYLTRPVSTMWALRMSRLPDVVRKLVAAPQAASQAA